MYQLSPGFTFGFSDGYINAEIKELNKAEPNYGVAGEYSSHKVFYLNDGLAAGISYRCSKVFCIDVDGINQGEPPFGYGIRVDGKILRGIRANEWIEKESK